MSGSAFARRALPLLAALLVLGGCSTAPQRSPAQAKAGAPWLALAPAQLGCSVAVQQRLTVQAPGQSPKELDALLEVEPDSLRLAILHMGQIVGQLEWDGTKLTPQLTRWWPEQLKPEQVLSDLQLAFWPVEQIEKALPPDWQLRTSPQERVLQFAGTESERVRYLDSMALEIVYAQGAWKLRIDTPGGAHLCANEAGKS